MHLSTRSVLAKAKATGVSIMTSPARLSTETNEDVPALNMMEVGKMQLRLANVEQRMEMMFQENAALRKEHAGMQQDNAALRLEIKARDETIAKLQGLYDQLGPYLQERFTGFENAARNLIDTKVAECIGSQVSVTKLNEEVSLLKCKVKEVQEYACKEINVEEEIAFLNNENRTHVGQFEVLKKRIAVVEEVVEAKSASTPYLDAVARPPGLGAGGQAFPKGPGAGGQAFTKGPETQVAQARCVVRAPRGMFRGRTAALRAQDFNKQVVAKLQLREGHFTLPEATSMLQLGGKPGDRIEMWCVTFSSHSEVSKLMEYKGQLKSVSPDVYVDPFLSKEEMGLRKLLVTAAKDFIKQQADSRSWRFSWTGNTRGVIKGPAMAKRMVFMDGTEPKVCAEGNVRTRRARPAVDGDAKGDVVTVVVA
jgi:hypothetical protein